MSSQIEEYEKNENHLRLGASRKDYNFDFFFEHTSKKRHQQKEAVAGESGDADVTREEGATGAQAKEGAQARLASQEVVDRNADSPDVTSEKSMASSCGSWEMVGDVSEESSSDEDDDVMDEDAVLVFEEMLKEKLKVTEKEEREPETRVH